MSTYTSQQARIRAALSEKVRLYVTAESRGLVDAIINGVTSASLRESAARLKESEPTSLAEVTSSVLTEMAALPALASLPPELATDLSSLQSDLRRAGTLAAPDRTRLVEASKTRLADLVDRVVVETSRVERLTVAAGLTASLRDLGYSLTTAAGPYTSALEASRGHEKVLVIVKDGGEVTTDWAGLRDASCVDRQAELRAAAARHGIDLGETKAALHHDPRGGETIAAAAKHHLGSLAEGAVAENEAKHTAKRAGSSDEKTPSGVRVRS